MELGIWPAVSWKDRPQQKGRGWYREREREWEKERESEAMAEDFVAVIWPKHLKMEKKI